MEMSLPDVEVWEKRATGLETAQEREDARTFLDALVRSGSKRQEMEETRQAGRSPLVALMVDVYKIWMKVARYGDSLRSTAKTQFVRFFGIFK